MPALSPFSPLEKSAARRRRSRKSPIGPTETYKSLSGVLVIVPLDTFLKSSAGIHIAVCPFSL
jgi:hypothetical protein